MGSSLARAVAGPPGSLWVRLVLAELIKPAHSKQRADMTSACLVTMKLGEGFVACIQCLVDLENNFDHSRP